MKIKIHDNNFEAENFYDFLRKMSQLVSDVIKVAVSQDKNDVITKIVEKTQREVKVLKKQQGSFLETETLNMMVLSNEGTRSFEQIKTLVGRNFNNYHCWKRVTIQNENSVLKLCFFLNKYERKCKK